MRILQIIDSLQRGGAEQAAVHLSNALAERGHDVVLCATRGGGPLAETARCEVVVLGKRNLLDLRAHRLLVDLIAERDIELVHAHSTSLFSAWRAVRARSRAQTKLVWHDHYGDLSARPRCVWPYRLVSRRLHAVVAASSDLEQWSRDHLRVNATWLPNAIPAPRVEEAPAQLPGTAGKRIICIANFRLQKDHTSLVRAAASIVQRDPQVHLFLVGAGAQDSTRPEVEQLLSSLELQNNVHLLGERGDVPSLLAACDIGVLSSRSEGLPLVLIEYGWGRLAVVCTNVGQCGSLLDAGRGLLVEPGDIEGLAQALGELTSRPALRHTLASSFHEYVRKHFDLEENLDRLIDIYAALPDGER